MHKAMRRVLTGLAVTCSLLWRPLPAAESYTRNGDLEQVAGGQATLWETGGTVRLERVGGGWHRLAGKFNSGARTKGDFLFFMYSGSLGSVWLDHIVFSPAVTLGNPSFEELGPDGLPAECRMSPWPTAFAADASRASDGVRSFRMTHEHEAVPETQMRQAITFTPNQEYTFSFDVLIGDDFQGEALGCVEGLSDYLAVSPLAEARDRCGQYALALAPAANAPATVFQELSVEPGTNLSASADLNSKAFSGVGRLVVEDAASGRVLGEVSASEGTPTWQSLRIAIQSASPRLRLRVTAEGDGFLLVDNLEMTPPRVIPPPQQVRWLPAAENFSLPAEMVVSIQGETGKAIDGGLALLGKDLRKHNVGLTRAPSGAAGLRITVARDGMVEGRGPESYSLSANRSGIAIRAGTEAGAFYGLMTLLQLIAEGDGKPIVLACEMVDYPDMPLRGVLYGDAEQAARWKLNTLMESTGYPVGPEQAGPLADLVRTCEALNLTLIPYALAMMGGYYVQKQNPNLAAGIWVQGEKITLTATQPSPLANPYVIRTQISDVKLKSADGAQEYRAGVDYRVTDGDMAYNYDTPNPKPFTVARLAGSAIPDGATVLASYDWVSHYRASDQRTEVHIAYVPLEPETRRLMDGFLRDLVRSYSLSYVAYMNCLHEFGPTEAQLATDSRVITSGRTPLQLFAEDVSAQAAAVKQGNPKAKAMFWAGSMNDHYIRAAEPFISRDAHVQIWGYDANWPGAYGWEAIEYWSKLGFESSVMSWDNRRNVRGWAQVVAAARARGYPCLGMINACWSKRTGGCQESASVSWKIPREGEAGFVAVPQIGPAKAR